MTQEELAEQERLKKEAEAKDLEAQKAEEAKIKEIAANPEAVKALIEAKRAANEEAKKSRLKLEAIDAEKAEAEKKKLAEQQEFQKLADIEKQGRVAAEAKLAAERISNAIRLEAARLQIPIDDKNLDGLAGVSIDADGKVIGAGDAVAALIKAKPYLVQGANGGPRLPVYDNKSGSGNGSGGKAVTYKDLLADGRLAQKMKQEDPVQYNALKKAYEAQKGTPQK